MKTDLIKGVIKHEKLQESIVQPLGFQQKETVRYGDTTFTYSELRTWWLHPRFAWLPALSGSLDRQSSSMATSTPSPLATYFNLWCFQLFQIHVYKNIMLVFFTLFPFFSSPTILLLPSRPPELFSSFSSSYTAASVFTLQEVFLPFCCKVAAASC